MVKKAILILLLPLMAFEVIGQNDQEIVTAVEEAPFFKGDLGLFIRDNIRYPISAIKDSVEGTVYIGFYIDTIGITFDHSVLRGVRHDLDEEALRVTRLLTFGSPAKQRGMPIVVHYIVPVRFKLDNIEVFTHPKQFPYYEGGNEKISEFILSNIDKDSCVFNDSKVFVGFTIDTLGNTYNHRILKGSAGECCNEALINACKQLHFTPAIGYDNKPQNYEYIITIRFSGKEKEKKCVFRRLFTKKSGCHDND